MEAGKTIGAVIIVKDDDIGLNSLLLGILSQTRLPNGIVIINTGKAITNYQLLCTINLVNIHIPITFYRLDNEKFIVNKEFHFGKYKDFILRGIKYHFDYIWFLHSDLFPVPNCLKTLLHINNEFNCAILPQVIEEKRNGESLNEIEYNKYLDHSYSGFIKSGMLFGLLFNPQDIKDIDLSNYIISEDLYLLSNILVYKTNKTFIYHTKISNDLPQFHTLIEDFIQKRI